MLNPSGTVDKTTGHVNLNELGLKRFWSRIDKNGPVPDQFVEKYKGLSNCWLWNKWRQGGYGMMGVGGWHILVHRISWMIHFGIIPTVTPFVLHRCDVTLCVRPDHLWVGTYQDNRDDCCSKNRQATGDNHGWSTHPESIPRGENHFYAKLTDEKVREIRRRFNNGERAKLLAEEFNTGLRNIYYIDSRKIWGHVD